LEKQKLSRERHEKTAVAAKDVGPRIRGLVTEEVDMLVRMRLQDQSSWFLALENCQEQYMQLRHHC